MRTVFCLAILVLSCVWIEKAHAELDLELYEKVKQDGKLPPDIAIYVTGIGRGIFWTNAYLENDKSGSLFCMPRKLSLDEGLIHALLEQEISSPASGTTYNNDVPIEYILLRAFVTRFPCNEAPPQESPA